jgi:hypothetical protein
MSVYESYLKDLGRILRDEAVAARNTASSGKDPFQLGRAMAYYEVVSLLEQQANAFQIPLEKLSFDGFDPEQLI